MPKGIPNKKPAGLIYAAKEAFTTLFDGIPVTVTRGTTVREGHRLLLGREGLFQKLRVDFELADEADEDEAPEPVAPPVTIVRPPAPPAGPKPAA